MIKNINQIQKKPVIAHKGIGKIFFSRLFEKKEFKTKIDFIDYVIIPPNRSIGFHTHGQNEEIYYVVKGEGLIQIGTTTKKAKEGSIILNKPGENHGFINNSSSDTTIFVFQVSL